MDGNLCPWDSPGKNPGVGCHFLQGSFLTQGVNMGLLHCRQILYHLSHWGGHSCVHTCHIPPTERYKCQKRQADASSLYEATCREKRLCKCLSAVFEPGCGCSRAPASSRRRWQGLGLGSFCKPCWPPLMLWSLPLGTVSHLEPSPAAGEGAVVWRHQDKKEGKINLDAQTQCIRNTRRKELGMGARAHLNIICTSLSGLWNCSSGNPMCPPLCCFSWDPMDSSPPGSSVHGIFQARILEWVAISFSRRSSWPRGWTHVACIGKQVLYHWATREASLRGE